MRNSLIRLLVLFSLVYGMTGKHLYAEQPAQKMKEPSSLSGKVIETMDSGRYTYVCLEQDGKRTWVAVYKMKVIIGQQMSFAPGVEMTNFESKTLKRTFDKIYFSGGPLKMDDP
jgi:hypothetical protein